MKRIGYTPELTDALRRKKRGSDGWVDVKNSPTPAKPLRIPIQVIADQVTASMAVEGRTLGSKLKVQSTAASKALVNDVVARSAERRSKAQGTS